MLLISICTLHQHSGWSNCEQSRPWPLPNKACLHNRHLRDQRRRHPTPSKNDLVQRFNRLQIFEVCFSPATSLQPVLSLVLQSLPGNNKFIITQFDQECYHFAILTLHCDTPDSPTQNLESCVQGHWASLSTGMKMPCSVFGWEQLPHRRPHPVMRTLSVEIIFY